MAEHLDKNKLVSEMRNSYNALEGLLATLNTEQMTTAGVNGIWSVKDNLAHITAWQIRLPTRLQAVREGTQPPASQYTGMDDDEINELIYQQNKDRSLDEVYAEFRNTSQRAIESIEHTSEDDLNKPMSWLDGDPVWVTLPGNTTEHYQEHQKIISTWLARTSK